jgi:CspA family cold shock protein
MPTGKIKFFDETRGFGFIIPDDGGADDIFFHVTSLREGDDIAPGVEVSFKIGADKRNGKIRALCVDSV